MRVFDIKIPIYVHDSIFSPIRDKIDYVKVLMVSANFLLLSNYMEPSEYIHGRIVIDKMSRLFIYNGDKYFSISFPFIVDFNDANEIVIKTYSGKKINHKSISEVLYIIKSNQFGLARSLIDFYIEPNDIDYNSIYLLEEILMYEPSYMRYDYDPDREDGNLHPLHHLDIHYSQYATLKIGLNSKIEPDFFEDIHNIKTDCFFINH